MIYLISYPRSGNTAFRFIIELLTKRPTNGLCGAPNSKDILQKPLLHNGSNFILHKRHDWKGVENNDFVFFLIRDPLEACIRHNEKPRGIDERQMYGYLKSWFELLEQFDKHGNGMVIYYDELLKIASKASHTIYPDPQSDSPDFHKYKLGNGVVERLTTWMKAEYSELYNQYL